MRGETVALCTYSDVYINSILFCIFSCFIGDSTKFNKYAFILALYMFIHLLKFKIMQCVLK